MNPPLTILTGFLGSGKTTLLRAMLERGAGGRRIALVVNEIGTVGFDGAAIGRRGGLPMVELTGGCICCAVGSDFLLAIEELIAVADPDQIVVETTGLAEPGGMIRQARAAGLPLDAVVAVADAAGLEQALATSQVAIWQLRAADIVVLSKVDLVDEQRQVAVEALLRTINSRATILPAARGLLDPSLLFGPRIGDDPVPAPGHIAQDGIGSIVWSSPLPLRRTTLEETLRALPSAIYRAKGIVHCTDAPWPDEVHYVGGRLELSAIRLSALPDPLNCLVLIGTQIEQVRDQIYASLDSCIDTPERASAWLERYKAMF